MSISFIVTLYFASVQSHPFFVPDKELQIGHRPANAIKDDKVPLVAWEPYFCVLLQDEQTLTAYRSEELSVSVTLLVVRPYVGKTVYCSYDDSSSCVFDLHLCL